jgi:hypothetical protein
MVGAAFEVFDRYVDVADSSFASGPATGSPSAARSASERLMIGVAAPPSGVRARFETTASRCASPSAITWRPAAGERSADSSSRGSSGSKTKT